MIKRLSPMPLRKDDRGVILVVGVFFTFLWIGMVWFLLGLGNVIAYRENMQNAADAAAFAGAVYDARGMNIIAMINNLMGVVLATLIVMKFAQIANMFAQGSACHSSENTAEDVCEATWGIGCVPAVAVAVGECVEDCDNVNDFKNTISSFDTGVHVALAGMHTVETLIAVPEGWPTIASGKSQLGGAQPNLYANGVVSTVSVSYSENPASIDPDDGVPQPTTGTCTTTSGGTMSDGLCAIGPRCGLPVTSDSYGTVCKIAMDDWTSLGQAFPSSVTQIANTGATAWYDFGAQWFCDDGTTTGTPKALNTAFTTAGTIALSLAAFWECEAVDGIESAVKDIITGTKPTQGNLSLIPMSGFTSASPPGIPATCPAYSTMAIYAPAKMGLDYYGVWASASGKWKSDGSYNDFAAKPVTVAGLEAKSGSKVVANPPDDADKALARAEFYYEPYSGGGAGSVDSNDTISNETQINSSELGARNVMWNMRWRARLRRFHFMPGGAGGLASVGTLAGVGTLAEASYLAVVGADTALLKVLALNVSGSLPSIPNVDSQSNSPPLGMYH